MRIFCLLMTCNVIKFYSALYFFELWLLHACLICLNQSLIYLLLNLFRNYLYFLICERCSHLYFD